MILIFLLLFCGSYPYICLIDYRNKMFQVKPKFQIIAQKYQKISEASKEHSNGVLMSKKCFQNHHVNSYQSNKILDSEYIVFVLHYSQLPAISILLLIISGLKLLMP